MIPDETFQVLLANLKIGLNIGDSCKLAGIARKSYYNFKKNKEKNFKITEARLMCKKIAVNTWQKAIANGNWKAASIWLERKHPEEFAETKKVEQKTEIVDKSKRILEMRLFDIKESELKKEMSKENE